jgi:hypothetical protein
LYGNRSSAHSQESAPQLPPSHPHPHRTLYGQSGALTLDGHIEPRIQHPAIDPIPSPPRKQPRNVPASNALHLHRRNELASTLPPHSLVLSPSTNAQHHADQELAHAREHLLPKPTPQPRIASRELSPPYALNGRSGGLACQESGVRTRLPQSAHEPPRNVPAPARLQREHGPHQSTAPAEKI